MGNSINLPLPKNSCSKVQILYISYDGMLEPLGQSQVLAYLKRLAVGRCIHLISFEKPNDWYNIFERKRIAAEITGAGIVWHPLRYHKRPSELATFWDIVCGTALGLWLVLRNRIQMVHARSYVPSVMALVIKRLLNIKYIFDMRGFWADEKVEGGSWAHSGMMYRITKGFERRFLLAADHVVSLTNAGVLEINRFKYLHGNLPPMTVIPTCADLSRFSPVSIESRDSLCGSFVLGYVGSVGTYYLFNEVIACFVQLRQMRPEARLLILNRGQHDFICERLSAAGVPNTAIELRSSTHTEMPSQMARMDAGIFFIKPVFSKQASAPTKLAEFLGCGIPCLSNTGVGDMADVLEGEKVGVALTSFDFITYKRGLEQLLLMVNDPHTKARCIGAAQRHFSLDEGVARYENIYNALMK